MSGFDTAAAHSVQSLINERALSSPDDIFCIFPESQKIISYGTLKKSLRALGGCLANVSPGESVGILGGNGWATTQILLGAPYHARIALILNLFAGDMQLAHMISHSDCRLIFADEENLPRLRRILQHCDNTVTAIGVSRDGDIGHEEITPPSATANSPALLIYTSGTTGKPKGVLHSHRSLLFGGANTVAAHHLTEKSRALCVLPLYHINGQCVTVFAPLVSGGSVVIPHKFNVSFFWGWASDYNCTWFSAVPTILSFLLHAENAPPLPHLRFGRSASSALSPDMHRKFEQKFSVPLVETMGLTETAAQVFSNPLPPQKGKYGSPGRAVGNEVKIVDVNGDTVPPNTEGEIAVRGDNLMLGYLREESPLVDGWLMTGDLAKMDEEGYVFITGRSKELIIKGGENIAPREIDEALYAAVGVVEAAAFGVACDIYGQRVEAAVSLAANTVYEEKELIELCHQAVGKFKSPSRIYQLESLPKGPSGKIQRLKLADLTADLA